jgi:hypothetical protein
MVVNYIFPYRELFPQGRNLYHAAIVDLKTTPLNDMYARRLLLKQYHGEKTSA